MDDVKLGRLLRALRLRRGWSQKDLGARAACSQQMISLIERGHIDASSLRQLRRVAAALDARVDTALSWRGGDLDRLADARHAALVDRAAIEFRRHGWEVYLEVTYSHFGERGSVDIFAVRRDCLTVAVSEVKSEIAGIEELVRRHDQKARLAAEICMERFGWRPRHVARILIVPDDRTVRRIISSHDATFAATYPNRTVATRRWISSPQRAIAGVLFLTGTNGSSARRSVGRPDELRRAGTQSTRGREDTQL